MHVERYDVVIVGASAAGCSAATLLARSGARVLLVEQRRALDAYKRVCTHFIQSCATPTLQRLGADTRIEEAGGVRNRITVWTRWGLIDAAERTAYGYNIRREKLDPILRRIASETPNVTLLSGWKYTGLVLDGPRCIGVDIADKTSSRRILAQLVVGADGRNSHVAEHAGVSVRTRTNARFTYYAYYANLPLKRGSQYWLCDSHLAYAFPNDNGLTLLGAFAPCSELDAWRGDLSRKFTQFWTELPDGPPIANAERVSEFRGMAKHDNISRDPSCPGLALIGDAAMSLDPVWGLGCTWAICSAGWLADCISDSLHQGERAMDSALVRYRQKHAQATHGHRWQIEDFARGKPLNPFFKLVIMAATRNSRIASDLTGFLEREVPLGQLLTPSSLGRSLLTVLRSRQSTTCELTESISEVHN